MPWPFTGLGPVPEWVGWLLYAVDFVIRVAAIGMIPGNRRPTTAMAWLLVIFFFPIAGLILFLTFGNFALSQRRRLRQQEINRKVLESTRHLDPLDSDIDAPDWIKSAAQLNRNLGAFPCLAGNKVELMTGYTESMEAMTEAVQSARNYVNAQFYIMGEDEVTEKMFVALEEAAARGVKVRVLFDHLGTLRIPGYRRMLKRLTAAGIEWRRMLPLLPTQRQWRRFDLRNHRKILVVDGTVAFTGSQNLIEPSYKNKRHRRAGRQWVELMARVRGPLVVGLNVVFATDWSSESDESLEHDIQAHDWETNPGDITTQVVPSGPGYETENNLRLFTTLIYSAQERISITSPYFVPDDSLLYAITTAAQRGVEVELFVSEKGDQFLVHHAQQSYYGALLAAGVRIYRYPRPMVLHAKHFTIDDDVAVLGSSNMDMRSFSLNLEVSVMLLGGDIVRRMRVVQDSYREISSELELSAWQHRPRLNRYVDNVARLTATLQ
jgi:cardiolipin synthase